MEVVKQRIADAQKRYDDGCDQIDNEAEEKKKNLADHLVADVLAR